MSDFDLKCKVHATSQELADFAAAKGGSVKALEVVVTPKGEWRGIVTMMVDRAGEVGTVSHEFALAPSDVTAARAIVDTEGSDADALLKQRWEKKP